MDVARPRTDRLVVALAAGAAAVGGSYLAVGFSRRFLGVALFDALLALVPDVVVRVGIEYLGALGQQLLFVSALAVGVAVVAVAAMLGIRAASRPDRGWGEAVFAAWLGPTLLTLVLTASVPSALGAGVAAALVVAAGGARLGSTTDAAGRRRVLRAAGAAVAAVGAGVVRFPPSLSGDEEATEPVEDPQVRSLLDRAADREFALPDAEPYVSEAFYNVDIAKADPDIAPESWSLSVTGAVETELDLTYGDVLDRAAEHRFVTLRCVSDDINGTKIDTALWTGIPVADLLEEAGVGENCCVMLRADDGYFVSFPLAALADGLLAYRMNGRPLPQDHGAPLRALVPGHWGETNGKWLTEIEVLDEPADGYWEQRGWQGTGPVETVAKVHSVETGLGDGDGVRVGGHAYAGTRDVDRVEVSVDGGESWETAELTEPLPGRVAAAADAVPDDPGTATDAWRMWRHEYAATADHEVVVRAVDGTGTVQPRAQQQSYPSGATGWVSVSVSP
ncbi:MAG: molybdopterin-dependent oxidoreductase [Halolamina sp.]